MPRGFNERERELIRKRLVAEGEALFGRLGLRKTRVEDVTKAAGIAKGSFYRFFSSREELFLAVLSAMESSLRAPLLVKALEAAAADRLAVFLDSMREALAARPSLARILDPEELAYLERKADPALLQDHFRGDDRFLREFVENAIPKKRRNAGAVTAWTAALKFFFTGLILGAGVTGTEESGIRLIMEALDGKWRDDAIG